MPSPRCTGIGCRSPPNGQMNSDETTNAQRYLRIHFEASIKKKQGKTRPVPGQLSSCTNYGGTRGRRTRSKWRVAHRPLQAQSDERITAQTCVACSGLVRFAQRFTRQRQWDAKMMPTMTPKRPRADPKISTIRILTNSVPFWASASAHELPVTPTHSLYEPSETAQVGNNGIQYEDNRQRKQHGKNKVVWDARKHTRRSQIPSLATADAKNVRISIEVPPPTAARHGRTRWEPARPAHGVPYNEQPGKRGAAVLATTSAVPSPWWARYATECRAAHGHATGMPSSRPEPARSPRSRPCPTRLTA